MADQTTTLTLQGLAISKLTLEQAVQTIMQRSSRHRCKVYFCNIHTACLASRNDVFHAALSRASYLLNDGLGIALIAKILHGEGFQSNLVGTDLVPLLLSRAAKEGHRIFMVVANEATAERLSERAREVLGSRFAGVSLVREPADEVRAADCALAASADLILVGLGQPRQEFWIDSFLERTGARLGLGVGAFLDIFAGVTPRAPRWMRQCKLEWSFRLAWEPGRLWKRYVIDCPLYFAQTVLAVRQETCGRPMR